MRLCSPDPRTRRSPDSPERDVHLISGQRTREPRRHPFDRTVAAFVADCRARNLSPRTVEFYLEGLTSYRAFAGGDGTPLTLADLDLATVRAWLAELAAGGRRPSTVAGRARAVRVFGNWIAAEGYTRANPIARMRLPVVPRTVLATFKDDEARELVEHAPANLGLVLLILLDTGLRLGEVTRLRLDDVGDGQLRVVGKGGHERAVPFGRALDAALRRYLDRERPPVLTAPSDPLLLGRDGRPMTEHAVYHAMRRVGRRLGLAGVRVSPHTCRHTFAVAFLRNGGNLFALQKILGHRDLAMVRRYAELSDADVAAEHRVASPLDGLLHAGRPSKRGAGYAARERRKGARWSSGESR